MKRVRRLLALAAAGALACAAPALAPADSPAGAAFAPVAHSALVTVDGVVTADTLVLRVLRTADRRPPAGAGLTVSVDGRSVPVTPRPEGTWEVPLRDLTTKPPGKISIVVAHDGLREVLDGQLPGSGAAPVPQSGNGAGALIHKQMAWWILNIVIVLIGVVAVSRRMS
jgi:hypothetical protein